MYPRHMFHPDRFTNVRSGDTVTGFQFDCRIQYYRGVTLSIIRDIAVNVDGVDYDRKISVSLWRGTPLPLMRWRL